MQIAANIIKECTELGKKTLEEIIRLLMKAYWGKGRHRPKSIMIGVERSRHKSFNREGCVPLDYD